MRAAVRCSEESFDGPHWWTAWLLPAMRRWG